MSAMQVTGAQLLQFLGLPAGGDKARPPARAALLAGVFNRYFEPGGIDRPLRLCHFLAQTAVETGGFASLVESTNYRDPARLDGLFKNVQGVEHARRLIAAGPEAIGNTIYALKNGNGSVESGDGYRFRGRGFLQVTGRGNYRSVGAAVNLPLEAQPEMLGEPDPAAQSALAFWAARKINDAADADDVGTVTLLVNGPARLHLDERAAWLAKARAVWPG